MPLITSELNDIVTFEAGDLAYISLHTADPSTTGANEVVGAPYARKALTPGSASGGSISFGQVTFDVAGGVVVTHVGFWSAASGGSYKGGASLGSSRTDSAAFQVKVTATLAATGS
jgi:hypothetical protein